MAAGPRLFSLHGPVEGAVRTYLLRPGLNRLGRLGTNQVILQAAGVSRRHALLHVGGAGAAVEDLASKNGCFVNGRRVLRSPLVPGDRLRLGSVELELREARAERDGLAIELPEESWPAGDSVRDSTVPAPVPGPGGEEASVAALRFPPGHRPGTSPPMRRLYRLVAQLAPSDLPVLILGETGVGKEAIARTLHLSSGRPGRFVAVNCAAIPADLLEAELFGIGDRVATGVAERKGVLAVAAGGTALLDEISDMPLRLQSKLLRALQEREIHPIGGTPTPTDARIVATSQSAAPAHGLRPDLYYRLAGGVLEVPPLRDRREDLPGLVEHFLGQAAREARKRVYGATAGALQELAARDWPGNVRELENEIRRLMHLAVDSEAITAALVERARIDRGESRGAVPNPATLPETTELDLGTLERHAIVRALERTRGRQAEAAALLGISRYALRRRLAKHGLEDPGPALG